MKVILWIIYQITRLQPLWFLLASAKAMNWNVGVERSGDNVKSIIISNPDLEEE